MPLSYFAGSNNLTASKAIIYGGDKMSKENEVKSPNSKKQKKVKSEVSRGT